MKEAERKIWLKKQGDKVAFAAELKDLSEHAGFKKIMEGMISKKAEFLAVIDNPDSTEEDVREARKWRLMIQLFIKSILYSIHDGDNAVKAIKKYEDFEKEKEEKGGGKVKQNA